MENTSRKASAASIPWILNIDTLAFTAAVPEPDEWAFMMAGLGLVAMLLAAALAPDHPQRNSQTISGNNMKRTLISTGLVAAFGLLGNVQAAGISATDALSAGTQLFMAGTTASSSTIRNAVKTAMCGGTTAAFSTEYLGHSGHSSKFFAIACKSPVTDGNAVFYYTALGSNFGINPVLYNGTGVKTPKLNLNTCTGTTCTGITSEVSSTIPDIGYSDINPTAFTGPNTPSATALATVFNGTFGGNFQAHYPALFNAMKEDSAATEYTTIYAVNGMQFAILISNTLATALGGTANSYPLGLSTNQSVSTTTIAGLMAGAYNGAQALRALGIADPSPSNVTKVAVCTLPATSGTKAWANTFFLGAGAAPKGDNTNSTIGAGGNWSGQRVAYVENLGSTDLRNCMVAASAQGIPAIGISSLEKSQLPAGTTGLSGLTATNFYAVARIDGISPDNVATADRINVRNGLYTYVGEATMQGRGDLSDAQEAVKDAIVAALTSFRVCADPGPTTQPDGVAGNGTGCETKWSRQFDAFARPVTAAGE